MLLGTRESRRADQPSSFRCGVYTVSDFIANTDKRHESHDTYYCSQFAIFNYKIPVSDPIIPIKSSSYPVFFANSAADIDPPPCSSIA